jgi:hypothetical protein
MALSDEKANFQKKKKQINIYLKDKESGELLTFTALPEEDLKVKYDTQYMTYNIIHLGKRDFPEGMSAREISWSGWMWGEDRKKSAVVTAGKSKWKKPQELIKILKDWQVNKHTLTLVASGFGINMDVTIMSFTWNPVGGHEDFKYSIRLKRWFKMEIGTSGGKKKKRERD